MLLSDMYSILHFRGDLMYIEPNGLGLGRVTGVAKDQGGTSGDPTSTGRQTKGSNTRLRRPWDHGEYPPADKWGGRFNRQVDLDR